MTLREEIKELSDDYIIEGIDGGAVAAGMLVVQALSASALAGVIALLAKLGDKIYSAVDRRKAERVLKMLDLSEKDKERVRNVATSKLLSINQKKKEIKEILDNYKEEKA